MSKLLSKRYEKDMIEPIKLLMSQTMKLDVIEKEFSAGYGIADLVGAKFCKDSCTYRNEIGLTAAFDHHHFIELLSILNVEVPVSLETVVKRISFAKSTLQSKVLPCLKAHGVIRKDRLGYIHLSKDLPRPTESIVAVEAKQTKWKEAILQARRYTFFAEKTYIAVWDSTIKSVDKSLLSIHGIGLISVNLDNAEIVIEAPTQKPKEPKMNRYCAEFLYKQLQ